MIVRTLLRSFAFFSVAFACTAWFAHAEECCPEVNSGPITGQYFPKPTFRLESNDSPQAGSYSFYCDSWVSGAVVAIPEDCAGHWIGFSQRLAEYVETHQKVTGDPPGKDEVGTIASELWDVNNLKSCPWYDGPGRSPVHVKAGKKDTITMGDGPMVARVVSPTAAFMAEFKVKIVFDQFVLALPDPVEPKGDTDIGSLPVPFPPEQMPRLEGDGVASWLENALEVVPDSATGKQGYKKLVERRITLHYRWHAQYSWSLKQFQENYVTRINNKPNPDFIDYQGDLFYRESLVNEGHTGAQEPAWKPSGCEILNVDPGKETATEAILKLQFK